MTDTKDLKQQAEEAAEKIKEVSETTLNAFKESETGKKIVGEDGKFGKDDMDKLANAAKEEAGKIKDAVLGEDGKFDQSDVDRLKGKAESVFNDLKKKF